MRTQYFCKNEQRKNRVRLGDRPYNGIDYLEVADEEQLTLHVRFLNSLKVSELAAENVRIEGGERIRNIRAKRVSADGDLLVVEVDRAGDFSPYLLRLVQGPGYAAPPEWIDPVLSLVDFSFKASCPSDFDCRRETTCPPVAPQEPEIDYLAKDYGSFRRLMLDRLSVIMPEWKERNPADIGVAAVEALAYAADRLSYYQDAVATEAYLGTARRRVSVRRHARMLDYSMHDGCNARVWVALEADAGNGAEKVADGYLLNAHTPLLTGSEQPPASGVKVCAASLPAGSAPPLDLGQFVLFALDSLCIQEQVVIHAGHIGANTAAPPGGSAEEDAGDGHPETAGGSGGPGTGGGGHGGGGNSGEGGDVPFPCEAGWSVLIGKGARVNSAAAGVYGDRVRIFPDAKVYDVFKNSSLDSRGEVRGSVQPLPALPLLTGLPALPPMSVGSGEIEISAHETRTLLPGRYGSLVMDDHATLRLSGGLYGFQSWQVGAHGKVLFAGRTEVRIAGRLRTGADVHIGPSGDVSSVSARDIDISAAGEPEEDSAYTPLAAKIGEDNQIAAKISAPGGLLVIGRGTNAAGTFFARWISVEARAQLRLPAGAKRTPAATRIALDGLSGDAQVFETMHDAVLRKAHNRIEFYTWGDDKCCLPRGATRASLKNEGNVLQYLKKGDLLLFEETAGIESGKREDADVSHRHVVRVTEVKFVVDPLYDEAAPYAAGDGEQSAMRVADVEWAAEDALPFPLCLHNVKLVNPLTGLLEKGPVGIARGNVVLADHGRTFCGEELVPKEVPQEGRYYPRLPRTGITFRTQYDDEAAQALPAGGLLLQDPREALPDVVLRDKGEVWSVQRHLLESDRFAQEFVVETEDDGSALVRFGDDILGKRPSPKVTFRATFRVGNGTAGNVGAETISQLVLPPGESDIQKAIRVRNPLPAQGGTEPETSEEVRLYAPQAFRVQKRAVTPADFADMAQHHPEVRKAVASRRWTGSWHTVFITVDRAEGRAVDEAFEKELREFLEPYRIMGHDLEIEPPTLAALDIALRICVGPEFQRMEVKGALQDAFGSATLADGRRGFFHPDNFTFGQHVYLSSVVTEAMKTPGIVWVAADRFQRWGRPSLKELSEGVIRMGSLEIARLDNDPNAPEHGKIEFIMQGGL